MDQSNINRRGFLGAIPPSLPGFVCLGILGKRKRLAAHDHQKQAEQTTRDSHDATPQAGRRRW